MEDAQLKNILESYNQKLEQAQILNMQSWVLNLQCFETLQKDKAQKKLKSLIIFKLFAVVLGILWVIFLGYIFYFSLRTASIFFIVSCGAVILFTAIAIVVYMHHINLISKINNSESVIKAQEMITKMKLSTISISRILFLQAPFYCTFWWTTNMIVDSPLSFWLISFPVALLFALASIWLYRNISIENINKKWFKILFNSPEWNSLINANSFLEEINSFKKAE